MSFTGVRGHRGDNGSDGTASQPNGGAGMQGGDAAIVYTTLVDAAQTKVVAKGGRGGHGGDGAASATATGGNGGDGGQGGAASSTFMVASAPALTFFQVSAGAVGGSGGDGGARGGSGAGAPPALGGNGGDGGQATAAASVTVTDPKPQDAYVAVSAQVQGGNGGSAGFGATGGAGASERLLNAATATTFNGHIEIFQDAIGGNGGGARNLGDGGDGGDGGDAASNLSLDDTLNPAAMQAASYQDYFYVFGGNGGAGSTHQGRGGNATSIIDLTGSTVAGRGNQVTTQVTGGAAGAELVPSSGVALTGGTADSEVTMHGASVTAYSAAYGGRGGDAVGPDATGGAGGAAHAFAHLSGIYGASAEVDLQAGSGGNGTQGAAGGAGTDALLGDDAIIVHAQPGAYVGLTEFALGSNGGSSDTGRGGDGGSGTVSLDHTDLQSVDLTVSANAAGGDGGNGGAGDGRGGDAMSKSTGAGGGKVYVDAQALAGNSRGIGGNATATAISSGADTTSRALVYGGSGQTSGSAICFTTTTATTSGILNPNAFSFAPTGVLRDVGSYTTDVLTGTDTASASTQYGGVTPTATVGAIVAQAVGLPSAAQAAPILAANANIAAALGPDPTVFVLGNLGSGHGALASGSEDTASGITAFLHPQDLPTSGNLNLGLYGGLASAQGLTEVKLIVTEGFNTLFQADIRTGDIGAQATALFTNHDIDLGQVGAGPNVTLSIELDVTSQSGGTFRGGILVGQAPAGGAVVTGSAFVGASDPLGHFTASHSMLAMLHAQ